MLASRIDVPRGRGYSSTAILHMDTITTSSQLASCLNDKRRPGFAQEAALMYNVPAISWAEELAPRIAEPVSAIFCFVLRTFYHILAGWSKVYAAIVSAIRGYRRHQ